MKPNWFSICAILATLFSVVLALSGHSIGAWATLFAAAWLFAISAIDDWPNPPAARGAQLPVAEGLF